MAGVSSAEPLVAPSAPTVGDWRTEVVVASSVNIVSGIWLIIAPFITGYTAADPMWNPIVCGAVVLVLAVVRAYRPVARTIWLSVANAAIGGWLFASAFWLGESSAAIAVTLITGLVVFCLAAWSVATSVQSRHTRM